MCIALNLEAKDTEVGFHLAIILTYPYNFFFSICKLQVCTPLLQFIFGAAIDQVSLLKTKEGLSDLKCPPTPTNSKLLADMMAETPKSTIRRSLKDMGTPRTPTVLNASFAKTAKQKLLAQGCEILLEMLMTDEQEINGNSNIIVTLGKRFLLYCWMFMERSE